MTISHVVACDFVIAPPQTQYGMRDRVCCPGTSRPAATLTVLMTVAARDGWLIEADRNLCPFHATEANR